ncbi:uncharacterized protein LOC141940192 [Strix uralensis]|uniref:uncharacterized protein LOC141940192 n=1 Tax=Strix uralensis TaxID=36305 RepID=UPI003DA775DB
MDLAASGMDASVSSGLALPRATPPSLLHLLPESQAKAQHSRGFPVQWEQKLPPKRGRLGGEPRGSAALAWPGSPLRKGTCGVKPAPRKLWEGGEGASYQSLCPDGQHGSVEGQDKTGCGELSYFGRGKRRSHSTQAPSAGREQGGCSGRFCQIQRATERGLPGSEQAGRAAPGGPLHGENRPARAKLEGQWRSPHTRTHTHRRARPPPLLPRTPPRRCVGMWCCPWARPRRPGSGVNPFCPLTGRGGRRVVVQKGLGRLERSPPRRAALSNAKPPHSPPPSPAAEPPRPPQRTAPGRGGCVCVLQPPSPCKLGNRGPGVLGQSGKRLWAAAGSACRGAGQQ